jgi:hypothetical protein
VLTVLRKIAPTGYAAASPAVTKAVVATCVVFVPGDAVGAIGVPVNVGLAIVGLVPNTLAPEPVEVVTPVPPDVTGSAAPRVREDT